MATASAAARPYLHDAPALPAPDDKLAEGPIKEVEVVVLELESADLLTGIASLAARLAVRGHQEVAEQWQTMAHRLRHGELTAGIVHHFEVVSNMEQLVVEVMRVGLNDEAAQLYKLAKQVIQNPPVPEGHAEMILSPQYIAEQMRQLRQIEQHVFGADHSGAQGGTPLASLAATGKLDELNKPEQAEPLLRDMMQELHWACQGMPHFGPEHLDLKAIDIMAGLAACLIKLNKQGEAEAVLRQLVKLRQKMLGREHPKTLESMANLAFTVGRLGKHEEAEPLLWQVLDLHRLMLGRMHPSTTICYVNYMICGQRLGRLGDQDR